MTGVRIGNCSSLSTPVLNIVIGKVGQQSAAARFAATTAAPDFSIESEKPYAEVCSVCFILREVGMPDVMGTFLAVDGHPSFSSFQRR